MKNIFFIILIFLFATNLFSQNKIDNSNYKFHIEFNKNWKAGNVVETNKKDVITYSFNKNKIAATIIAFKFVSQRNLDDFIYTLEKDFNLNIPERTSDYSSLKGDVFEGKSAEYKDKETIEKIYYYTTTTDSSGEYFCYMIRFIGDFKLTQNDFNNEVSIIIGDFKIKI